MERQSATMLSEFRSLKLVAERLKIGFPANSKKL